jgi:hypothetical protein
MRRGCIIHHPVEDVDALDIVEAGAPHFVPPGRTL